MDRVKVQFTVNQLVGFNMTYFRKAAGLTQEELGERLGGWSAASVSAAERSWDGKRVRKFDADELVMIAEVLGVPVAGLFLPPDEGGPSVQYVLDLGIPGQAACEDWLSLILPVDEGESPVMDAYRKRLIGAGVRLEGFERDVQDEHREAVAPLIQERVKLERRIDDLRMFERDYRAKLHNYLASQLSELWSEDTRSEVKQMIEEMSRKTADGGGHATGVLLRDDGTYDFVQFGAAGEKAEQEDQP